MKRKAAVLLLIFPWLMCAQARINAGGPAYTDAAGVAWEADRGCTGGYAINDQMPIWGAPPLADVAQMYRSKRYGTTFTCAYAVPDGQYTVSLYFIESTASTAGLLGRVFSVTLNGAAALVNYDLWAEVGQNVPTKKTFTTTASGGTGIKLAFSTLYRSTFVNSIEIVPVLNTGKFWRLTWRIRELDRQIKDQGPDPGWTGMMEWLNADFQAEQARLWAQCGPVNYLGYLTDAAGNVGELACLPKPVGQGLRESFGGSKL